MTIQIKRRLILVSLFAILFSIWESAPTTRARNNHGDFAVSQAPADWVRYTVKGEEFSVSLPVMPAMATQTNYILKLDKRRQHRVIAAYADGVVYAIYSFENPKRRQSLEDLIAEFYGESEEGTPINLTLDGFNGKEYSFESADRRGVSQFYITDRHVYLFRAMGSLVGNLNVAIPKFISSIRLEKRPEGTEIVEGPGEQPSSDPPKQNENSEARPFSGKDVTRKASVITKPEPPYTEAARKNAVTGTVVLRCVFSSSGAVTNIRVMSGLPHGLTEKAIAAARQIRFIPAIKDGQFVSMYIQLEYNFNLY